MKAAVFTSARVSYVTKVLVINICSRKRVLLEDHTPPFACLYSACHTEEVSLEEHLEGLADPGGQLAPVASIPHLSLWAEDGLPPGH